MLYVAALQSAFSALLVSNAPARYAAPPASRCAAPLLAAAEPPHVAIVGAGWGGWGAAKALIENGCRVTLLDALHDPTGKTPYLTPNKKPFEAGTRGFWIDYPNINDLTTGYLGLEEDQVFTDFTNSSFYSPDGLEATAPVFSQGASILGQRIPELPSPLGQVAATFELFERIPVADRVTMIGLLYAMLDYTRDEATFEAYDRMSAHQLFIKMGISPRLVRDFIRPTLLVGLFKPPEELSAAVAMELLYFYALAHQTAFDVRWIRSRSISELLVAPLADKLAAYKLPVQEQQEEVQGVVMPVAAAAAAAAAAPAAPTAEEAAEVGAEEAAEVGAAEATVAVAMEGEAPVAPEAATPAAEEAEAALRVLGGSFVSAVDLDKSTGRVSSISYVDRASGETRALDGLSGCVLALCSKGMKAVVNGSPTLARSAPELCQAASLDAIDVIAVRLWLDTTVPTRTPANVFSRFEALRGAGGTFFMLDQLQDDDPAQLWGEDEVQGSVVACDFYNAGALLALSDEDITSLLMDELLPSAVSGFRSAKVVDAHVQRFPGAVTWFSPGSYSKRPPLQTSVSNLVCAGDWVRLGEYEHGAKGLCQERAYVSGLQAANALARSGHLGLGHGRQHLVIPVRDDEPQVVAGRTINKAVADAVNANPLAKALGLGASPWVR